VLVIRCTAKLLKRTGAGPPRALRNPKRPTTDPKRPATDVTRPATDAASTTRLGDWFATLVNVGRERFVLLVSERSRLPVIVRARGVAELGSRLIDALTPVLEGLGLPDDAIRHETGEMREWVFAPTNNRSVVGSLNDFSKMLAWHISREHDADLTDLALKMSETPILALDDFVDKMTIAAFGTEAATAAGPVRTFRCQVTLDDSRPPIWRRFDVPADISLADFHRVLQAVMGWTGSHLHMFEKDGTAYGTSNPAFGMEFVSERETRLDRLLQAPGSRLRYLYDFGDEWSHEIVLEAIVVGDSRVARVLDGARACPPENIGGMPRYEWFLEVLADAKHPDRLEAMKLDAMKWSGGRFDPDAWDIEFTNRLLRRVRLRPRRTDPAGPAVWPRASSTRVH